jgi:hypothetical protein
MSGPPPKTRSSPTGTPPSRMAQRRGTTPRRCGSEPGSSPRCSRACWSPVARRRRCTRRCSRHEVAPGRRWRAAPPRDRGPAAEDGRLGRQRDRLPCSRFRWLLTGSRSAGRRITASARRSAGRPGVGSRDLAQPDGDMAGEPWTWTRCRSASCSGGTRSTSTARSCSTAAQIVLPKGSGKSPTRCGYRLLRARRPDLFDGFDADGNPVGRRSRLRGCSWRPCLRGPDGQHDVAGARDAPRGPTPNDVIPGLDLGSDPDLHRERAPRAGHGVGAVP